MSYKEQIIELRKQEKTYDEIKEELGCSKGTISYHCKQEGLEDIGRKQHKLSDEKIQQIKELRQRGKKISEISYLLDVSESTVVKYQDKNIKNTDETVSEKVDVLIQKNKHTCDSCSEKEIIGANKYCDDCLVFYNWNTFYEKLGIKLEKNWKKVHLEAIQLLNKKYHIEELSLVELKNKYGIHYRSLERFFNKFNLKLRNSSEAAKFALKNGKSDIPSSNSYEDSYHIDWKGNKWYLRSSYEKKAANALDELKIDYYVEDLKIKYGKNNKIYVPDFYLPNFNLIIETKSDYFIEEGNVVEKNKAVLNEGYSFLLLKNPTQIKEQIYNLK